MAFGDHRARADAAGPRALAGHQRARLWANRTVRADDASDFPGGRDAASLSDERMESEKIGRSVRQGGVGHSEKSHWKNCFDFNSLQTFAGLLRFRRSVTLSADVTLLNACKLWKITDFRLSKLQIACRTRLRRETAVQV